MSITHIAYKYNYSILQGCIKMMLDDKYASIYWCTELDVGIQGKKLALSQLTFGKCKWILNCCWKTENVTEVQRRWRNDSGVWCWWWTC
jgi:hypothetical protein